MNHVVGIADMKVSDNPSDMLITYSLGSCIGLSLYDPELGLGGMMHCMLPLSKMDPVKAAVNPMMYVDSGASALLRIMYEHGASRSRIIAKVAGGSSLMDEKEMFQIGQRNYTVIRKVLWKNEILIAGEDVGGNIARTMALNLGDGTTTIRSRGKESIL